MAGIVQFPDPATTGPLVPTADATVNTYERDVVGNKSDAAVSTVGTVASIIAYLKGLLNVASLRSTTSETNFDSTATANTVRELVASSAAAIRRISFAGTVSDSPAGTTTNVFILTGGAGSEVNRGIAKVLSGLLDESMSFYVTVQINLAAGTRVAWKFTTDGSPTVAIGYTIEEA